MRGGDDAPISQSNLKRVEWWNYFLVSKNYDDGDDYRT